jgi:hypothetical protein
MEFTKELKYYTLFIALVALFGVFFKAMENPNRAMAQCIPSGIPGDTCDLRPTPTPLLAEGHQEELVFTSDTQKLIYQVFGEKDWKIAYAIAQAESGLDETRCHIDENEYSCGLFQINLRAHQVKVPGETLEEKAEWLKVPANNIITAKFIRATSGWRAWSVYLNESYLKFL